MRQAAALGTQVARQALQDSRETGAQETRRRCCSSSPPRGAEGFRAVQPYSSKSWFLRGVAPNDRVFLAGRHPSSSAAHHGRGEEEQEEEEAAVAAAAVGAGCLVVIGDLNAEWGTAALVRRLCAVHGWAVHRGAAANVLGSF